MEKNVKGIIDIGFDSAFKSRVCNIYNEKISPSQPIYSDSYKSDSNLNEHFFNYIPKWFVLDILVGDFYASPACLPDSMVYDANFSQSKALQVVNYANAIKSELYEAKLPKTKLVRLLQQVKDIEMKYAPKKVQEEDEMEQ